jgi:hypothetical protein
MANSYNYKVQYVIEVEYTGGARKFDKMFRTRGSRVDSYKILSETVLSKTKVARQRDEEGEHLDKVRKIIHSVLKQHGWSKVSGAKFGELEARGDNKFFTTTIDSGRNTIQIDMRKRKYIVLRVDKCRLYEVDYSFAPRPKTGGLDIDLSDPESFSKIATYCEEVEKR